MRNWDRYVVDSFALLHKDNAFFNKIDIFINKIKKLVKIVDVLMIYSVAHLVNDLNLHYTLN